MMVNQKPCDDKEIDALIHELEHASWLERQQARLSLEKIGGDRVQEILKRSQSRGFLDWLRGN